MLRASRTILVLEGQHADTAVFSWCDFVRLREKYSGAPENPKLGGPSSIRRAPMPDKENPYEPTSATHFQAKESEPIRTGAGWAVRNACRYAIPVMSIGWGLLTVEFYYSNSHRMNAVPAAVVAGFQSLTFTGIFLGVWLGCAAIVGAIRR